MANPSRDPSRSATESSAAIDLAIGLLESRHDPEKVEAALVYRGYTRDTSNELVQGLLRGRIKNPATDSAQRAPKDWASLPPPVILTLGLLVLTVTVAGAVARRVIFLNGLIIGLLISCAGVQALIGPKRRGLVTALCLLLIVLATAAARFLRSPA